MNKQVVIIGGGVAGMEAAGQLAMSGLDVTLIERDTTAGGHLNNWFKIFPDRKDSAEVKNYLDRLISQNGVKLITGTLVNELVKTENSFLVHTSNGEKVSADAVVVATGFDLFRSSRKEEYGYGIYDNVITSADLEEMFRQGKILMADGKQPQEIGFVHCVGSRDEKVGNLYCSKLCCVTAVKQAIEIREQLPETKVFCFYMDMRMGGAHYEELYREAQEDWGVNFIRGKVSEVSESIDNRLIIKAEDTLTGRPLRISLDMLVLMAGMEMSEGGKLIAESSGLTTGDNKFFSVSDPHFGSNKSNIRGIFYAGTCTMPMNITETISHARAVVSDVMEYLDEVKG